MPEIDLFEAMSTLRAVRRLKPDPIPENVLAELIQAASWAPTGGNVQPWRVVVVREPALKAELGDLYATRWRGYADGHRRAIAHLEGPAAEASERMLKAGDYLGEHFGDTPAVFVFCFRPDLMAITDQGLDRVSVVGGASVYTAVENLLLACRAHGLGCTLTTLLCECEPEVKRLLDIPGNWGTAAAVPVGYPLLRGHGPISRRPVEKLAFRDRWGQPFAPSGDDE